MGAQKGEQGEITGHPVFRTVVGPEMRKRGWQEPNTPGLCPEMTLELRVPLQLCGMVGFGSALPLPLWVAENLQIPNFSSLEPLVILQ